MSGKVSKSGDTMTGTLAVSKVVGYSEKDWQNAQFLSRSRNDQNEASRAGYGFENSDKNAALLYLEAGANRLKVKFNNGESKTLAFTDDMTS